MINYDLKRIRALMFDVDGVLSAETISHGADGEPVRTVNIKDGYALRLAQMSGLHVAIITGAHPEAIRRRYQLLGIEDVFLSCSVKTETYERLKAKHGFADDEVVYMGDDIPDYEIMRRVGCPVCPADAAPEIKAISLYISHLRGGYGCARDVIEQVLKAQGKWMADERAFGW
ncbi:MAG: HAD-IIIA family hydrolase [Bacteroidaceae bacterium]|nr:HAD-IIIA family hydrolase [Bacteroidaceae bacterium]